VSEIQPRDILFRAGGQTLARYGVPVWRRTIPARGGEETKETFTRADAATCATLTDRDGIIRTAAANTLRIDWPSGLVDPAGNPIGGLLLEGSRANALTKSQKFDDAAWTKTRASVTADATAAPDGTVTADKLVEDASAGTTHLTNRTTPALTDNTPQAFSAWAKAAERSWIQFLPSNKAGTLSAYFDLGTGALGTVDANVVASIVKYATGWCRCGMLYSSASGATSPVVRIQLATGNGGSSYGGNGVSGVYLWGAQFETDRAFPSSSIGTDAAAVTRAADSFTVPCNVGPMDLTVLVRLARPLHADASGALGVSPGIFSLGAGAAPRLGLYFDPAARNIISVIDTATTDATQTTAIPAGQPTICVQYKNLTTGGQTALDVGSGFTAFSSAATAFSAFSSQVLRVGRYDDELFGVVGELIIARGLFSRAELMAVL